MPKLIAIILILLLALAPITALADSTTHTQWVRIVDDSTTLHANSQMTNEIVVLPKSYYLQVLQQFEEYLLVQYMDNQSGFPAITGYVKLSDVELCTSTPISPCYPHSTITVTGASATMYLSPLTSSQLVLTATNTQQLSYYGKITKQGKLWYYVYFGNQFGYISMENVSTPNMPLHSTPLTTEPSKPAVTPPTVPNDQTATTTNTVSTSEIILIIFVCLLSTALVIALFMPSSKKNNTSVWDQQL